ncbi:SufE family protein [Blattabacterium cuenoti]|uniref:SufE family protein n=1 Tax=Blattabacterium cuenoti TaxID=1653831 RepID=UPI00163C9DAA|nr:SufE family protein [Blattabacterium cuenoti]
MNLLLKEKEKIIKDEFKSLYNWEDKYQYLISLGEEIEKKSKKFRSNDRLIDGCQSRIWIDAKLEKNRIFFEVDSDAIIPKGMAALMANLYSGVYPNEIIMSDNKIIYDIGLIDFLSPIRANGLILLLEKIKLFANHYNNYLRIEK